MSFSSEEEDSSINPNELVFLLAIAGRIDAQSRLAAKKLDKNRYIYHAYAVLDSLSSSYSMFKYFFEVFISHNNDPKLMHEILTSPAGIAAFAGEALFLVTFSFLASYFDGEKEDNYKKFIAMAWPYFRDVIKALKNAYKGWKSAIQIMTVLGGIDIKFLVLPLGVTLGVLAAANRFWLRHMVEKRKSMMDFNSELLLTIKKLTSLTKEQRQIYFDKIQRQTEKERIHAFFAVASGGLIDGLYLYAGVVSLTVFAPPIFIAMAAISAFYTLACIVSRAYEEYDFQLQLKVKQTRCELALTAKELEILYAELLLDSSNLKLRQEISGLITQFESLHDVLKSQITHNYFVSFLLGIKYGLFAYGVLACTLFMFSAVFLITATAFPPALVIACIVAGLVFMLGITAYTTRTHYLHLQSEKNKIEEPYHQLIEIKEHLHVAEFEDDFPSQDSLNDWINDGLNPKASPQFFFQDYLEIFRSFVTGISKGNGFGNLVGTPLQDIDTHEHDHDHNSAPIMFMLQIANAILFSIILALRAFARGFGRPSKAATEDPGIPAEPQNTQAFGEENRCSTDEPSVPLPKVNSVTHLFGLFSSKRSSKLKKSNSISLPSEHARSSSSDSDCAQSTTQGLV